MALSLLIFQENSCRWMLIKYSCELPFGFCILVVFLRALHPSRATDIDFKYVTVWHYRRWLRVAIEPGANRKRPVNCRRVIAWAVR